MKIYLELLYHFTCDKCQAWWSIGSRKFHIGVELICPFCGHVNFVDEIDESGNSLMNRLPKSN